MDFSFNSYNESAWFGLAPDPRCTITAAARAGYARVGLDFPTLAAFCDGHGTIGDVAQMLADAGIGCSTVTAAGMYGDGNDVGEVTRRAGEWASALGAAFLQSNFMTSDRAQQVGELEQACRAVEAVAPGVKIAIEHMPIFGLNLLNDAVEVARGVGFERAGVLVDVWHVSHGGDTWADLEAMPMEAVAYLELCDALAPIGDDLQVEMTGRRTFPGEGVLDVNRFCRTFAQAGYDGMISVEIVSEAWRGGDIDEFAARGLSATQSVWNGAR
ncbi:MAG: TIM barrel protein [Novosphingobium sp.]